MRKTTEVATEEQMAGDELGGEWRADPTSRHAERYYLQGQPTDIVRDGGVQGIDPMSSPNVPSPPLPPAAPPASPVSASGSSPLVPRSLSQSLLFRRLPPRHRASPCSLDG